MDAHPVPQNVTTFEFRLIGDMTLKQFIYLASGVGMAYLLFVTIAAKFPFVAWPLIVILSLLGVAYAFLPIQDRPLDHWTAAFFKAIYSPTKRIWKKNGKDPAKDPLFKNRLNIYLSQAFALPSQTFSAPPPAVFTHNPITSPAPLPTTSPSMPQPAPQPLEPIKIENSPTTLTQQTAQPLPTTQELSQTVELGKQAQILQLRIIETERKLAQVKQKATDNKENPGQITVQFNEIFENLHRLTEEASGVKQQLASLTKQPEKAPAAAAPVKVEVVATTPKPKPAQITLTTFPNVINGIINDPQSNYLEGVVVVIHDKDGLPVRALKTNKLGQFTGSTPLPNGTYTVELEKDNFSFDILKIDLDGKVLPPLTIMAKAVAAQS